VIFVCIASYNRPRILQRCLNSLEPIRHRVKMVILHQGQPHTFIPRADRQDHYSPENLGCAGARKYLAETMLKYAQPDDISIWLDDDLTVTGDAWLGQLCTPIILNQADITGVEGMQILPTYYTMPSEPEKEPDYVSGGWCAISARVFLAGCMFDTRFFPNYWEDVDLCRQAKDKSFRIAQVPNHGLHHIAHDGDMVAFENNRREFIMKYPERLKA
jgi:GT2 family glycosyltransferase